MVTQRGGKGVFQNLSNLLLQRGITHKSYAEFLNISEKTVQNKLNRKTEFTFAEVKKTHKFLFPQYNLDYLFEDNEETEDSA